MSAVGPRSCSAEARAVLRQGGLPDSVIDEIVQRLGYSHPSDLQLIDEADIALLQLLPLDTKKLRRLVQRAQLSHGPAGQTPVHAPNSAQPMQHPAHAAPHASAAHGGGLQRNEHSAASALQDAAPALASLPRPDAVWSACTVDMSWGHAAAEHVLAISPDGTCAATVPCTAGGAAAAASTPMPINVWDLERQQRCMQLRLQGGPDVAAHTTCAAFGSTGDVLLTGGTDSLVRVWDLAMGRCTAMLSGLECAVAGLAVSPDGTRVAACSGTGQVWVWEVGDKTGAWGQGRRVPLPVQADTAETQDPEEEEERGVEDGGGEEHRLDQMADGAGSMPVGARSVAFSHDGRTLAVACGGSAGICVLDLASGQCVATLPVHALRPCLAFSPPDASGPSPTLFAHDSLWCTRSGRRLWQLDPTFTAMGLVVRDCAFLPGQGGGGAFRLASSLEEHKSPSSPGAAPSAGRYMYLWQVVSESSQQAGEGAASGGGGATANHQPAASPPSFRMHMLGDLPDGLTHGMALRCGGTRLVAWGQPKGTATAAAANGHCGGGDGVDGATSAESPGDSDCGRLAVYKLVPAPYQNVALSDAAAVAQTVRGAQCATRSALMLAGGQAEPDPVQASGGVAWDPATERAVRGAPCWALAPQGQGSEDGAGATLPLCVAFACCNEPDGSSGDATYSVRVVEAASGRTLCVLSHDTAEVKDLVFMRDGRHLATVANVSVPSLAGFVQVWDLASGEGTLLQGGGVDGEAGSLQQVVVHSYKSLLYSPASGALAALAEINSSEGESVVHVWQLGNGTASATRSRHQPPCISLHVGEPHFYEAVQSMAFNASGTLLATADSKGRLHLWDAAKGACLASLCFIPTVSTCNPNIWRVDYRASDGALMLWSTEESAGGEGGRVQTASYVRVLEPYQPSRAEGGAGAGVVGEAALGKRVAATVPGEAVEEGRREAASHAGVLSGEAGRAEGAGAKGDGVGAKGERERTQEVDGTEAGVGPSSRSEMGKQGKGKRKGAAQQAAQQQEKRRRGQERKGVDGEQGQKVGQGRRAGKVTGSEGRGKGRRRHEEGNAEGERGKEENEKEEGMEEEDGGEEKLPLKRGTRSSGRGTGKRGHEEAEKGGEGGEPERDEEEEEVPSKRVRGSGGRRKGKRKHEVQQEQQEQEQEAKEGRQKKKDEGDGSEQKKEKKAEEEDKREEEEEGEEKEEKEARQEKEEREDTGEKKEKEEREKEEKGKKGKEDKEEDVEGLSVKRGRRRSQVIESEPSGSCGRGVMEAKEAADGRASPPPPFAPSGAGAWRTGAAAGAAAASLGPGKGSKKGRAPDKGSLPSAPSAAVAAAAPTTAAAAALAAAAAAPAAAAPAAATAAAASLGPGEGATKGKAPAKGSLPPAPPAAVAPAAPAAAGASSNAAESAKKGKAVAKGSHQPATSLAAGTSAGQAGDGDGAAKQTQKQQHPRAPKPRAEEEEKEEEDVKVTKEVPGASRGGGDEEEEEELSDEEFIVERIVCRVREHPTGRARGKPRLFYRVRWEGYGPEEDTWEPHSKMSKMDAYKEFMENPVDAASREEAPEN